MTESNPYEQESNKIFSPQERIREGQDGWLSPNGNFYPCETTEHDACAKYIVESNEEFGDIIGKHPIHDISRNNPPRINVEKAGFILVRSEIPQTWVGTFTPEQIRALKMGKIEIINPTNSIKCPPEVLESGIHLLQDRAEKIKQTKPYLKMQKIIKRVYEEKNVPEKTPVTEELLFGLENSGLHNTERFALITSMDLDAFQNSPFTKNIRVSDDHKLAETIFEKLSRGHEENLVIGNEKERMNYLYRVASTKDPNICLMVHMSKYRHDGISSGIEGNDNYKIGAALLTPDLIQRKIKERLGGEVETEYKGSGKVLGNVATY